MPSGNDECVSKGYWKAISEDKAKIVSDENALGRKGTERAGSLAHRE